MNPTGDFPDHAKGWFSRIDLRQEAGISGNLASSLSEGYSRHQLIWRLFADDQVQRRDFLFRAIEGGDLPGYYLVSARPPEDDQGLWRVQSKAYAPRLQAGESLIFSLRANAVVTRQGRRHDVVMDAKREGNGSIQEVGAAWLEERAGRLGFQVNQVVVDGYLAHCYHPRGQREIRFSTLDFDGWLTVTDPRSFTRTLFQGIGPAKGFGCGLLLARRP